MAKRLSNGLAQWGARFSPIPTSRGILSILAKMRPECGKIAVNLLAVPHFCHYSDAVRPHWGFAREGPLALHRTQHSLFKDLELCARSLFSLLLRPLP